VREQVGVLLDKDNIKETHAMSSEKCSIVCFSVVLPMSREWGYTVGKLAVLTN